jgi:acetoin utilization deacetylase AcuC-like enzyme
MKAFFCDQFVLPLPADHRFPMQKYRMIRDQIVAQSIVAPHDLFIPEAATDEQLLRVHTADYVDKVRHGTLSDKEIRRIGFPWSPQLVERATRSVGGSIAACTAALSDGIAVNLAGGTHHAFPDYGSGFCVFNDVAVAVRAMQAEHGLSRVVILDCDVHQGDGTAAIFAEDAQVFTFSIHGAHNFPFHKQQSHLDIELEDATGDAEYLDALQGGVQTALDLADAELAIYLAGADPFVGDRLGRMALSKAGLAARDDLVLKACRQREIPVAVVMAGGYARQIQDIVDIHVETIRIARRYHKSERRVWGNATL